MIPSTWHTLNLILKNHYPKTNHLLTIKTKLTEQKPEIILNEFNERQFIVIVEKSFVVSHYVALIFAIISGIFPKTVDSWMAKWGVCACVWCVWVSRSRFGYCSVIILSLFASFRFNYDSFSFSSQQTFLQNSYFFFIIFPFAVLLLCLPSSLLLSSSFICLQ